MPKKKIKIFYNPDCSKCREAMDLLEEGSCEIEVVEYLKNVPSREEIKEVLSKLGLKPLDLIRQKEAVFQEKFSAKNLSDEEWITALIENPELIERPILIDGNRAIIGRPPSLVVDLLKR